MPGHIVGPATAPLNPASRTWRAHWPHISGCAQWLLCCDGVECMPGGRAVRVRCVGMRTCIMAHNLRVAEAGWRALACMHTSGASHIRIRVQGACCRRCTKHVSIAQSCACFASRPPQLSHLQRCGAEPRPWLVMAPTIGRWKCTKNNKQQIISLKHPWDMLARDTPYSKKQKKQKNIL